MHMRKCCSNMYVRASETKIEFLRGKSCTIDVSIFSHRLTNHDSSNFCVKTDKQQKSSSVWIKYLNVRHTKAGGAIIDLVKLKKSLTAAVLSCITSCWPGGEH